MADFSFIQLPELRTIIEREYLELQELDPASTPKAVLVLSGAVLEGVLLDALVTSGKFTFEAGCQRHLNEMIGPAKQRGIITEDRLSDSVRKYRALVHLGREARDRIVFGTADATLAKAAVDVVIREVKEWNSRRGKTSSGLTATSRTPIQRPVDEVFLPATQEALELTLNSGSGQLSILISSDADEEFLIAGVTAEFNGSSLGKMNRPKPGDKWLVPAKGKLLIEWPPNSNVIAELPKLRGQYQGQFQAFIDFVFQCLVDDERREFRRRMNVQVDALNKHAYQW